MKPILYEENTELYNNNGIGMLTDVKSCEVVEGRNANFDFTMTYPVGGRYFKELKTNRLLKIKPNDVDEPHVFRILDVSKTMENGTVTVTGVSKTRDLTTNLIKELNVLLNYNKKSEK